MAIKIEAASRLAITAAGNDKEYLKFLTGCITTTIDKEDLPKLQYRMMSPKKMMLRGFGVESIATSKLLEDFHYTWTLQDLQKFLDAGKAKTFKR